MFTRRFFIGGLAGAIAAGPRRLFAAPAGAFTGGKPALTIGVMSDVHVCLAPGGEKLLDNYTTLTLARAFEWFRDGGADVVVIAGDIAHSGLGGELKAVADAWFKVFPNDKAPDGRRVERVFVVGNHDWADSPRAKKVFENDSVRKENLIKYNPAKWWDAVFHEEWKPHFMKTVTGYPFVGAHWCHKGCTGHDEQFTVGLEDFYASCKAAIDPGRPFFHVQHPVVKGTIHGDAVWGQDDGVSTHILSAFPNAIAFSGHCHISLTDERSIWQGAFTSVGCASMRDVSLNIPGLIKPKGGFENGGTPKKSFEKYDHLKAMFPLDRTECRQAQLVRVYPDRAVFSRREFMTESSLGDDLVMPLPVAESKPFAFAPRAKKALAPEFPKDAELRVKRREGRLRGDAKKKESGKVDVWELTIPAACAVRSARAGAYEITAVGSDGKEQMFGIHVAGARFPLTDPRATAPCMFRVACKRLPKEDLTFSVRAVSCWGAKSAPLVAKVS